MTQQNYKFTFIIPVYKVEAYLEDTIQSVINQTIGFQENIQMVLVNDGSPDNSGAICEKYEKLYPNNVVYVRQENGGVCRARNHGLEYARGEIVNFLDSDDKWSPDVCNLVWEFMEEHSEITVAACRIRYFENREDYHALDYKFKKARVVDIRKDYRDVQMHIASTFIRKEALQGKPFEERLRYGEDARLVTELIMAQGCYGVLPCAVYFYRVRENNSSAMQNYQNDSQWYLPTIMHFHRVIMEKSKEKYGEVIPYIQYMLLCEMKWRIVKDCMPEELRGDLDEYTQNMREMMASMEDRLIGEQKGLDSRQKLSLFGFKYQRDVRQELHMDGSKLKFRDIYITDFARFSFVNVNIIEVQDSHMKLWGRLRSCMRPEDFSIIAKTDDGKEQEVSLELSNQGVKCSDLSGEYARHQTFTIELDLNKVASLALYLRFDGCDQKLVLRYGKLCKLNTMKNTYGVYGTYIFRTNSRDIFWEPYTPIKLLKKERRYCKELRELGKADLLPWRRSTILTKLMKKSKVWLVSDRVEVAGDNGEAFFQYLSANNHDGITPYFVLSKDSPDYERMSQVGKVVPFGSELHKKLFLRSDKLLSSHADEIQLDLFGEDRVYMRNLYDYDFVFLQHGITKHDLSGWLNKYNKNIALFVTAARKEYDSIVQGEYYYDEKQVKLTGFPRYDKLISHCKREKQIVFMPTWRKYLVEDVSPDMELTESSFYQFYGRLIQDERLLEVMRRKGYKGKFCLHPRFAQLSTDAFLSNDVISVWEGPVNYHREFVENELLVTDYSSVAFDFAYMKKPVIYAQFDREEFYAGHTVSEGYYSDQKDGYGPVCTSYDETIQAIVNSLEEDCELEDKYLARIEDFYAYTDRNNCQRVYEEVRKL